MTQQTYPEFMVAFESAAAEIDAEFAALTDAQRRGLPRHRSARIDEIRRAHSSLHHPTGRQITIARLARHGIDPASASGYGPDKVLANLARAGAIRIYSDRQRRPHVVKVAR